MISVVVVGAFPLAGISIVALAGVDPEPFKNQLGAVENIINSAHGRVVKTMSKPPSDAPSPNLNGAVNRLEAISNQLTSADDMVRSIAEEVMGVDPNPFHPDIIITLEDVRTAAQGVVEYIHDNPLGDEVLGSFKSSVEDVQLSAQAIVDTVIYYLGLPSDCGFCVEMTSADLCGLADGSFWVSDHCCPDPGDG